MSSSCQFTYYTHRDSRQWNWQSRYDLSGPGINADDQLQYTSKSNPSSALFNWISYHWWWGTNALKNKAGLRPDKHTCQGKLMNVQWTTPTCIFHLDVLKWNITVPSMIILKMPIIDLLKDLIKKEKHLGCDPGIDRAISDTGWKRGIWPGSYKDHIPRNYAKGMLNDAQNNRKPWEK